MQTLLLNSLEPKTYTVTVEVDYVDYSIDDEDVESFIGDSYDEDVIAENIDSIKEDLPQNFTFEFEGIDEEDIDPDNSEVLDDLVCSAISDETGWLVNDFAYEVIRVEEE